MIAGRGSHAALAGYEVVELATEIAGPYATMLLADLGAHVVRLERPDADPLRTWGPLRAGDSEGGLSWFLNDMKDRVDIGTAALTAILDTHLERADVLVESLGAGGLEAAGVSVAELRSRHPQARNKDCSDEVRSCRISLFRRLGVRGAAQGRGDRVHQRRRPCRR